MGNPAIRIRSHWISLPDEPEETTDDGLIEKALGIKPQSVVYFRFRLYGRIEKPG